MTSEVPLIFNPAAGQKSHLGLALERIFIRPPFFLETAGWPPHKIQRKVESTLASLGIKVRPFPTAKPEDAERFAQVLAKNGEPLILASGGDGTINEVINGLGPGSKTALGIIPTGTTNSFALDLGVPLSIEGAVKIIRSGSIKRVDMGKIADRLFVMGAGASFYAEAVRRVKPSMKRIFGAIAYIIEGVKAALTYDFPEIEIEIEGNPSRHKGYLVMIANTRYHGGYFVAAPQAKIDDGRLDLVLIKEKNIFQLLKYLHTMRWGDITKCAGVEWIPFSRARLTSSKSVEIHADAELCGHIPCDVECLPSSLQVLAPQAPSCTRT